MLYFKEYKTSKVKRLGVGFLVVTKPHRLHECVAFVLEDDTGFHSASDLKNNILELGIYNIEGLIPLMVGKVNDRGDVLYDITDDANFGLGNQLSKVVKTDVDIFHDTIDFLNTHRNAELTEIESICGWNGVVRDDYPFVEKIMNEIESGLKMQKHMDTLIDRIGK